MHHAFKLDGLMFDIGGDIVTASVHTYHYPENENRPRIDFYDAGGPYACLTVNLGNDVVLADDEIAVKTWSENQRIADALRNTTYFEDTGKRVAQGFVQAQIWRIKIVEG